MTTSTINPIPNTGDTNFNAVLQKFLREEDAERTFGIFNSFTVFGGIHGAGAGLVGTPSSLLAFPGGFFVVETASIVYPDNKTHIWVYAHKDTTTVIGGNFVRVPGTHYIIESTSVTQPTTPVGCTPLMDVTTLSGAITGVEDIRIFLPNLTTNNPAEKVYFKGSDGVQGSWRSMEDALGGLAFWKFAALLEIDIILDEAKVLSVQVNPIYTLQNPFVASVVNDVRTNKALPEGLVGDMTNLVVDWNGDKWVNSEDEWIKKGVFKDSISADAAFFGRVDFVPNSPHDLTRFPSTPADGSALISRNTQMDGLGFQHFAYRDEDTNFGTFVQMEHGPVDELINQLRGTKDDDTLIGVPYELSYVDGDFYAVGAVIVDQGLRFSCNVAGVQVGTFQDNLSKWDGIIYSPDSVTASAPLPLTQLVLGGGSRDLVTEPDLVYALSVLTIAGDLVVNGSNTIINSTDVKIRDKNIEIGNVVTPTDATADQGGITLLGTTPKQLLYDQPSDAWKITPGVQTPLLDVTDTFFSPDGGTWGSSGINVGASSDYRVDGTAILADAAGVMTLSNVDALDATTQATILAVPGNVTTLDILVPGQLILGNGLSKIATESKLVFNGTILTVDGGLSLSSGSSLDFGGVVILDDDVGGHTLNNIDGLDSTTRTTIENTLLTLPNLTMIGFTSGGVLGPSGEWSNNGFNVGPNDMFSINNVIVLDGAGATQTLKNIEGLDATTEATILAIAGLVTTPDAQLISGNASGFTLNQLKMSLDSGLLLTHAIKTRHNEFNQFSNAIDFFLWDPDEDATGDVGTLPVLTLLGNGKFGVMRTSPSAIVDILSLFGDTTPVIAMESGGNAGHVEFHVGNRNPNGAVTGAGPDVYFHDAGALSGSYENRAATSDQVWLKRSVNPPEIIEIHNSAELDDLASGGVITISTNTTWVIKAPLTTANRIDVTNASIFFHITGEYNATASITYTGTGTFITSIGLVRIFAQTTLISTSTGTLLDVNGGSGVNLRESSFIGWDDLGSVVNTGFFSSQSFFQNIGSGFTLNNNFICTVATVVLAGTALNGPFFTINTNNPFSQYSFSDVSPFALGSTGSLLDLDTRINNNAGISVTRAAISVGNLFKQSVLTDATINSVADGSPATGTITAMADNGSGGTTISSTTTTYFEDEEVTITGTTSYNGTFQIFNVVAGVSYDIIAPFVADDATGSIDSARLTLSLAGGHGISTGDSIKVIDTNFYNGFDTTLNVVSDDITINGVFISTNTGSIERELSVDQTDRRVNGIDNKTVSNSATIACAHVNDNSIANGAIVNDTSPIKYLAQSALL